MADIVFALAGLAAFGLPMLLIAVAIRLDSNGPILFAQRRSGLNGEPFLILKFRTMRHAMADRASAVQARRHDPRLTGIGGWLRQTSLDELPQLFNVLRGDMSMVGPRPHAAGTRAGGCRFAELVPLYGARHLVRPGLTGLAQIRGWRGETDTADKLVRRVESDLEYIGGWSLALDLAILAQTGLAVVRARNAY